MNMYVAMNAFVAVADSGSFSVAARRLGLSTTACSRHVADLERHLGVALLRRTTRHVTATEIGARYLARASAIVEETERLNAEISAADLVPRGRLRITAPPAIGHKWIAQLAIDFVQLYPEIDLDLELTERVVDLVAEGFDAAVRSGPLASSSLIAHRIIEIRYRLCASPAYLEARGRPEAPDDVRHHACLHWRGAAGRHAWTFIRESRQVSVPIIGRLLLGDIVAEREAALRGLGLAILPELDVRGDLESGRLVNPMPDWEVEPSVLSLVRPPLPFELPKLRVFIDFITEALRRRAGP